MEEESCYIFLISSEFYLKEIQKEVTVLNSFHYYEDSSSFRVLSYVLDEHWYIFLQSLCLL